MHRLRVWMSMALLLMAAGILPGFGQNNAAKTQANPVVALDTTMGIIEVQLFPDKAPVTVKNFLDYVSIGFYDGTIVHRVDFVVGFGGYTEALSAKPTLPGIKNESRNGLKNTRGALAMARYEEPNSATSQFFINLKENSHLDPQGKGFGYAVFGKVIGGMEVVDKIAKVKTGNKGPFSNIPLQTITVKSAKVVNE